MPRLGREFEKLVSRIEQALIGNNTTVKSPDYINDKDTKQKREVDASVTVKIGSIELLILVECRKRKKGSDVRWIEQLIAKRESLNASKIVAVTSKPLTKPAILKAAKNGVDVRSLAESSPEKLKSWFQISDAYVTKYSFGYKECYLEFFDKPELNDNEKREIYDFIRNYPATDSFLIRSSDGALLSIDDLWKTIPREVMVEKIPEDLSYAEGKQPVYPNPGHELFIETPLGKIEIRALHFHAFAHVFHEKIPVNLAAQYKDAEHPLANVFEYEIDVNGQKEVVTITHDIKTGNVSHSVGNNSITMGVNIVKKDSLKKI